ncbi:FG-GAP-like repeat-containing protein, partial [Chloroflexota bacterium]
MKIYILMLALVTFLVQLSPSGLIQTVPVEAQELNSTVEAKEFDSLVKAQAPDSVSKISTLLALHVQVKLDAITAGGVAAALESSEQQRQFNLLQSPGINMENIYNQRIFIHFIQEPTQSQIEELEAEGIIPYPDSWIPPLENHPTGFIVADMPVSKLEILAEKGFVTRLETAELVLEPQNDLATQKINVDAVWSSGYNGTGVRIAVLDSGFDFTHPDIPTPIFSKDYGFYPDLDDTISNNITGHGTHVTGSVLGRGTQSGGVYKGSAPGADLIFLKIGGDTTGSASTAAMVNAIQDATDNYSADIITISYGGWNTYHDGTSEEAQAVDYAVSQGAVVFISAGNSANDRKHYSGTVAAGPGSWSDWIEVIVSGTHPLYFNMVWYDGTGTSNDLELHYYSSNKSELSPAASLGQTQSSRGTESEYSYYGSGSPTSVDPGTYYLKVENHSSNSQIFHVYSSYSNVIFANPDPNYTITSPADANSAIAVGAYVTRPSWTDYTGTSGINWGQTINTIANFSSRGPRVDTGAPSKPNIVAPGSAIVSARDNDVYSWPGEASSLFIDNDGINDSNGPADYYVMQGTSMACPIAAGVAALILEKNPTWTPVQVKSVLESTATDKGTIGHDNIYGWGLINASGAISGLVVTTTRTDNISARLATLEGSLDSLGDYSSANVSFEWGTSPINLTQETTPLEKISTGSYSANIGNLSENTTYYFRAKATVGNNSAYGEKVSFTTLSTSKSGIWHTVRNPSGFATGITFVDANNLWVVGSNGIIAHTSDSGNTSTIQTSNTSRELWGACFVNTSNGWVVGSGGIILHTSNDGTTWTSQTSNTSSSLYSVDFVDSSNGWTTGSGGAILRTSNGGIIWTAQTSNTTTPLFSVDFIDINIGWAVGMSGIILHTINSGVTWTVQNSNTTSILLDVIFVDANNGWAVGSGIILNTSDGGDTWTTQNSGTTFLSGVDFTDINNGWVAGQDGTILHTTDGGSTWATQTSGTSSHLMAIDFIDSDQGLAVGERGTAVKTTNGGASWTIVNENSSPSYLISSVDFINSSEGWAAIRGRPLGKDWSTSTYAVLHTRDGGATWTGHDTGISHYSRSIDFVDTNNGWMVGSNGKILHTSNGGSTWISQTSNTTSTLYGVSFVDANNGWVVGSNGTILHTSNSGNTWSPQTSNTTNTLNNVYFITANEGWVVGSSGEILHTSNGSTTWTAQTSNIINDLYDVSFPDISNGWVVGSSGKILYTSNGGNTWTTQTSNTTATFYSVNFADTSNGWAVGGYGIIIQTTNGGNTWTTQNRISSNHLRDVYATDSNYAWAVGYNNVILRYYLVEPPPLTISSKTPNANALDIVKTTNIEVQFNTSINGTSVDENTFNVDGSISGKVAGGYSDGGTSNITFNPTSDFKAGETVTVTLTTGIKGTDNTTLASPVAWQFVVEAPQGYAVFIDSGQSLGNSQSYGLSLGDFDGDGDLDAFVTNYSGQANKVWLNNGSGYFTDSSQSLGSSWSSDVALGDVDGDGDLDAFVTNFSDQDNKVWLNDGSGNFTESGQSLGGLYSFGVFLGDVDGDGDLDAFVANYSNQPNNVWLNDGSGSFSNSGQSLGNSNSRSITLGDVDGDGDLDAFVANQNQANKVWLNNGSGNFTDSGLSLSMAYSMGVSLGDVDGDGDLDAFIANYDQANKVWLNNGSGSFSNSGQSLGSSYSYGVSLGDVDDDGDLDAFIANYNSQANKVWLNNGSGSFNDSGLSLGSSNSWGVSLGDVDGDGDLDAFVANYNQANSVWLNEPPPLAISSRAPVANALDVAKTTNIQVQFSTSINGTTVNDNTFNVDGSISGKVTGSYSGGGTSNITFSPTTDFKAGETVTVTLTTGIRGEDYAIMTNPVTWQFVVNAPQGYANFEDSGQSLGSSSSSGVSLGDVDGDGDLDAFVANYTQANRLWLNDGSGSFADSGQSLGSSGSYGVSLGDIDGDSDLDAFVANTNNQANKVWLNNGSGNFTNSGQSLGNSNSRGIFLGDVDGDGDLDALVVNEALQANKVWLNDGSGNFVDSSQSLGSSDSFSVSLGDVDGDGDLDAFVTNYDANNVWLNDGSGNLTDSGQSLGSSDSFDVSLGDVDGDGDLDAFVINYNNIANKVWLNDGIGNFTDSGQSLGSSYSFGLSVGDVDNDGDLDAFVANGINQADKVWLNDGSGNFTASVQSLGSSYSYDIVLGDVDGDGDLDAFVANANNQANKVWLNVPALVADTSIYQGLDTNDMVVVKVNIDQIKDQSDNSTANITGGIGSYTAVVTANSSGIEVLGVNGVAPFENLIFDKVTGVFSVAAVSSPIQAENTTVAEIVMRLTGNVTTPYDLTVVFQSIGAAGDSELNVPEEHDNTFTFQRGDANGDGKISMIDAMFAAQVYVKVKTLDEINALNAASV